MDYICAECGKPEGEIEYEMAGDEVTSWICFRCYLIIALERGETVTLHKKGSPSAIEITSLEQYDSIV